GVRLFTAAETPKEKESPNKARRDARGLRRVIKRRRGRMNEIKKLCISNGLLEQNDLSIEDGIFNSNANRTDVWMLRHDALYRLLSGSELARILIHISKHRGFKFIGDDETDEESGKVKTAGKNLRKKFTQDNCETVGEWLWKQRGLQGKKRNKSGDYEISIPRDFLEQEIKVIFEKQQNLGSTLATNELRDEWLSIALYVRPMQSIKKMVGTCTYFPDEKRAPKSAPTAERSVAVQKFFSTVTTDNEGNERKIIEYKTVQELLNFATSKEKLDYKQLRKFLELNEEHIFKGLAYKGKPKKAKKGEEDQPQEWEFDKAEAEKKVWINLKGHAKFKEALGEERFVQMLENIYLADKIATVLTYFKDEQQKRDELGKLSLSSDMIEMLSKISFTDFNQLSLKAIYAILPEMMNGKRYDEAIGILGKPANEKSIFLPPLKETDIAILNPTVIRAFAQFRKVANALVKKYGSFDKVHFELARDVNTKGDIDAIKKGIAKNTKERAQANEWINENFTGTPTTRKNILKKRLFEQQGEVCPYTGERIKLESLFDEGYCEIDHILPRSRSADDSQANKVLCMSKANQDKTNRTPFEWFGHDNERWERFEARMGATSNLAKMGKGKVSRLLKKNFDENSEKEFVSRNLNDTRYMSKAIKDYCKEYWQLNSNDGERIQVRSGKLTSELRHQWGLDNKNRDTHTHHAADAIMIAFSTQGMVQRLSQYYATKETRYEKEKPILKSPMENFRECVEDALTLERTETIIAKDGREVELNRLIISRPPRASVTGAAHKETIQSPTAYKGRGVKVNDGRGMCDNGDMPRVDVFSKEGKYYLIPIYVADFAKDTLPKITAYGDELLEDAKFLFSMYKDDIIGIGTKVTANKPAKEVKGYFAQLIGPSILLSSFDNGEAAFFRYDNGKKKFVCQLNILNAVAVKKYTIDPLGYYHEVKNEKRLGTIPQEAQKRKFIKNS
ncbi:MAG: type II CRISPR RNA-guided endonuclease Cas9, partial [Sulfuricurvum sp.]